MAKVEITGANLAALHGRRMARVLLLIAGERERQERLKRLGEFRATCADAEMTHDERMVVLVEEVGEIARAVLERSGADLRDELIQVAAVAVAWVEALDAEAKP